MGKNWIYANTEVNAMRSTSNLKNRWVYLMLGLTATSNPFAKPAHASRLKLMAAPGVGDHLSATLELLASNDHYNIEIHNKHKSTHGITEIFDSAEIDRIQIGRTKAKKLKSKNEATQQEEVEQAKKPDQVKKKRPKKL